jgi:hypothetical protein
MYIGQDLDDEFANQASAVPLQVHLIVCSTGQWACTAARPLSLTQSAWCFRASPHLLYVVECVYVLVGPALVPVDTTFLHC